MAGVVGGNKSQEIIDVPRNIMLDIVNNFHNIQSCVTSGKSIKVHLYWAMKNCGGSLEQIPSLIKNVPQHYMVHNMCLYIGSRTIK